MTPTKDILKLDLSEDIKNVIDLEDQSEKEIQLEIESYIITDGLSKHLHNFIKIYQSPIKETGVWLSGFYGSGKSYFGKMLGYILANRVINGTPARDRFLPRLKGVKDENFIINEIGGLSSYKNRVVSLDVAKQPANNNLSLTLFRNFLKSLNFLPNVYGYWEFLMFLDGELSSFKDKVKEVEGEDWDTLRRNDRKAPSVMRRVLTKTMSEVDYSETLAHLNKTISDFSPNKLKEELQKYLDKETEETVVFIFDEASEAISQKRFDLLELEGISEALSNSNISGRVWTIAIAQEKLDDVINNNNISRSQLIKVTDRFKTKIHLESTEVDVIIRNRLLLKKEEYHQKLIDYYKKNEGLVTDSTNLKSNFPTKTTNAEDFAIYYPFHRYQFDLLQKFLFSSNALVANQIAARGMIITTFDVLRKQLMHKNLYEFGTAYHICSEAQTAPPARLVNKYDTAKKILENINSDIDGELLLKTIHFLKDAELVATNSENITKAYLEDLTTYYVVKPKIEEALEKLSGKENILLFSNNEYKITSDQEATLLEEMNGFNVELFLKKRDLVADFLKKNSLLSSVSNILEDAITYNFQLTTDLGDEIKSSTNKNLGLVVYSLFSIHEDREDFIENLKFEKQGDKNNAYLIPDNAKFAEIDELMTEVKRLRFMEEKYSNDSDSNIRQIIRNFSAIKNEKLSHLTNLINEAYANSSIIYLFDETMLNKDTFKGSIAEVQKKIIKNIYTKRLEKQISEKVGIQLMKEHSNEKLHKFFSGDDFKFFDQKGNFIGDGLKVVEEVTNRIKSTYADGKSLESSLIEAPTGYNYGTVSTTLATLFRAGNLIAKYNGQDYFSYKDPGAADIFATGRNFQKASFKAISKSLSANQKKNMVDELLDLKYPATTGHKIDWNTNDYELVDAVRTLADKYIDRLSYVKREINAFAKLFPSADEFRTTLQQFTGKTTDSNYIEKAETFLASKKEYRTAVKGIEKIEKFIQKNLPTAENFKRFFNGITEELEKAEVTSTAFVEAKATFDDVYANHLADQFGELKTQAQVAKDVYFDLMSRENKKMFLNYQTIKTEAGELLRKLEKYPFSENASAKRATEQVLATANKRIFEKVDLQYHIKDKNSGFSLSEMYNYNKLAESIKTDLMLVDANIVTEKPEPAPAPTPGKPSPTPTKRLKTVRFKKPMAKISVKEYRNQLLSQMKLIAGMADDDLLNVEVE